MRIFDPFIRTLALLLLLQTVGITIGTRDRRTYYLTILFTHRAKRRDDLVAAHVSPDFLKNLKSYILMTPLPEGSL